LSIKNTFHALKACKGTTFFLNIQDFTTLLYNLFLFKVFAQQGEKETLAGMKKKM
jgi:hypothetical protein